MSSYFWLPLTLCYALCFALVASQTPHSGKSFDEIEIPDGIYVVSDTETTNVVAGTDGDIFLGELISSSLGEVTLKPNNNENSSYSLTLLFDAESTIDKKRPYVHAAIIVIDDRALVINGAGGDGADDRRRLILNSDIESRELAQRIATRLKFDLEKREHPGHELSVAWKPAKDSFSKEESVTVEMTITNSGTTTVKFLEGGQFGPKRDNQFSFECQFNSTKVKDIGSDEVFGGLAGYTELKPGESHSKKVDLRKWFAFDQSGTWSLQGSFQLPMFDPAEDGIDSWTNWDDQVSGDFQVVID